MDTTAPDEPLIDIPYVDATVGGSLAVAEAEAGRFQAILGAGRRHYGTLAIGIGDMVSRSWLLRRPTRLAGEIDDIAQAAGKSGVWLLNLSYEWSCTTGTGPDPDGVGNRMLRTLDWPLDGLGEAVVVAKFKGKAGPYFNITWPGFVGVVTAMAPGRFSAAINQPPIRGWSRWGWAAPLIDWPINRTRLMINSGQPPTHVLREVFDTCATYDEAREVLARTPLAMPAFITLSGTAENQSCLIEREENAVTIHEGPTACANHWPSRDVPGRYRGVDSPGRQRMMADLRDRSADDFGWVRYPILNETTRIGVIANARTGKLIVRGYERGGAVTRDFARPLSA